MSGFGFCDNCEPCRTNGCNDHERVTGSHYPLAEAAPPSREDFVAQAQRVRSEHEATHGEAEMCGAECIVMGLAEFPENEVAEATPPSDPVPGQIVVPQGGGVCHYCLAPDVESIRAAVEVEVRAALAEAEPPSGCTSDKSMPGWCSTHLAWFHPREAAPPSRALDDGNAARLLKYLWMEAAVEGPVDIGHVRDLFQPTDPLYEDIEDAILPYLSPTPVPVEEGS